MTVLRYIHQNPVKAGIVTDIGEYKWSSYNEYLDDSKIVDIDFVLKMLSEEQEHGKLPYIEYMGEPNEDKCLEYEEKFRVTDNELQKIIEEKYGLSVGPFHLLERQRKDEILHELKAINGVTIRQLVRVTGASKFVVKKA